ncbi:MAG: hypothetical protein GF334_06785 [Candidatus Altiarchaeales archaeon]|nr:hypothetical protein [Candidatus Altiarchaeales archaeon]
MSRFTAGESRIKQACRETLKGLVEGNFPDRRKKTYALTLPGPDGLTQPEGLEQWFLNRNQHNRLDCLERNSWTAIDIVQQAHAWKGRVSVHRDTDFHFFVTRLPMARYHLVFLDWMGSLGIQENETLHTLLSGGWLDERAILAVTVNASGRCRRINSNLLGGSETQDPQEQALRLRKYLMGLAQEHRWKVSEKSYVMPYSCFDLGSKKVPMLLGYLVGMGGKPSGRSSYSAYE